MVQIILCCTDSDMLGKLITSCCHARGRHGSHYHGIKQQDHTLGRHAPAAQFQARSQQGKRSKARHADSRAR